MATLVTNINNYDQYESFVTPFLSRVDISKLLCSVSVDFNSAFYIIHTVLDIESKHYKRNFVKLSTEAAARRCSLKFHKIYRKAHVLESLFIKVTGL